MTLKKKKVLIFSIAIILAIVFWSAFVWRVEISGVLDCAITYARQNIEILNKLPLCVLAIAIFLLPLLMLPVTPVFILAGSRPEPMWLIMLLCGIALTLNIAISYYLGRKFRFLLAKILSKRGYVLPAIPKESETEFILIMRLVPGNPLAVQNYFLGMGKVNAMKYFALSLPIQWLTMYAYITFGDGFLNGKLSSFVTGISLLLVVALIAKVAKKKFIDNKKDKSLSAK